MKTILALLRWGRGHSSAVSVNVGLGCRMLAALWRTGSRHQGLDAFREHLGDRPAILLIDGI